MKLPELAIRRPVFVTVVFLILGILGSISFFRLPVDLMPDTSMPVLTVSTSYSNVGPEEIEELITVPLERSLSSTPGLEEVTSNSSEGNSQIRLSFAWSTDLDAAADEVRTRLDRARGSLPQDTAPPTISKFDVNTRPILYLGIGSNMEPRALREFVEKQLSYRFERIAGVAQVQVWGGLERQIQVQLNREKTQALRISPAMVINALRRENLNEPAGEVIEGDFETLMRTRGEYQSLDEIRRTMVERRDGGPVYLSDIATVEDTHTEIRNLVRINGQPGLRFAVIKQSGANTVTVARAAIDEIERINRDFPDIRVSVISDTSRFIERAVANVRNAALFGSILAVFILLLFLRNIRSMLVIAISIPISVIGTFALMYFYGFTLNTITFGGLALGVGMLVDNAIVVLENIFRHRQDGETRTEASRKGASEVALAITASTLTTIVVFIPVVFMTGMAGIMFQQMAWVVSFALFSSLLVALTLVPLLASRLVRVEEPDPRSLAYKLIHTVRRWLDGLDDTYAGAIRWSLRHRSMVIASAFVLFISSLFLIPFIGFELQPEADEGEVRIDLQLAEGLRLDVTDSVARLAEQIVRSNVPEAERVLTEVGSGNRGGSTNSVEMRVSLVPQADRNRSTQEIANSLRPQFEAIPGVVTRIRTGGNQYLTRQMGGGNGDDRLSVNVRGFDLEKAHETALRIRRMMESTPGISDASVNRSAGRAENQIRIDRAKAAAMGLSVSDIATTIRTSLAGTTASYFREQGDEYEILVRFREADRLQSSDAMAIPIQTPGGAVVPLSSLVEFQRREGRTTISRTDQQRVVTVSANLDGTRDIGSIVGDLQQQFQSIPPSPDMAVVFGGEWEEQQETFRLLAIGLALAVTLVYLVMAAQFESFKYPFLIMFSLPLASIGVVLSLFLTDTTFNIQAFIGAIMLVGIAVNNAIVLVDYVLQLWRDHNHTLVDALTIGGRRRLRPILMTTLTTILGLIPMAFGIGEGSELQVPMARVLIGGLLTSTFITLFLIPSLFLSVEVGLRSRKEAALPAMDSASPAAASRKFSP